MRAASARAEIHVAGKSPAVAATAGRSLDARPAVAGSADCKNWEGFTDEEEFNGPIEQNTVALRGRVSGPPRYWCSKMTAIALARRCAVAAALALVLLAAPAAAQRPMFGYEAPHQRAQRLRAEAASASRPPQVPFAREQPQRASAPAPITRLKTPSKPRPAAMEMSFWGEAVPLDSVQTASAQLDDEFEALGEPGVQDSILVNPPYLSPGEVIVDDMPHASGVMDHGVMMDDGVMMDHGGWSATCDSCAAGSHCQGAQCGGCASCAGVLNWFEVFGGSQGFTGPMNIGETASFGFHEGFNVGVPFTLLGARDLSASWACGSCIATSPPPPSPPGSERSSS